MPKSLARSIAALAIAMLAVPALAQQPTDEQISAIRASCRSDFMAHCAGVPRGGADALRCLKQNVAQLSPGCQAAVNAVGPKPTPTTPAAAPAAPSTPSAPAPAAAAPPTAPAPSAPPAPSTPPAPAASAPAAPSPKPVATPAKPVRAAPPTAAATPAPAAPAPAAQPATLGPIPPLPPRARLMILRACAAEYQAYCANVPAGGGRIVECLANHGAALSAGCRGAILSAR